MSLDRNHNETRAVILTYHSIDESNSVISISREQFNGQMSFLAKNSFQVIPLKETIRRIREKESFSEKSLSITFDDGFKNFYTEAYPVLKEHKFPVSVFLVTGFCGRNNRWEGQPKNIPSLDLLNWDEIAKMAQDGIDFGSHSVSHADLSRLAEDRIEEEIMKSKQMIFEHLGKNPSFFAYPYGKENHKVKEIVQREFEGACSTHLDFVTLRSHVHSLSRIDMYYFKKDALFQSLGGAAFSSYLRFRSLLRAVRS